MKHCPFCAETIQDGAIVCRFCNRDLSPATDTPRVVATVAPAPPERNVVGLVLAIVFVAMALAIAIGQLPSSMTSPRRLPGHVKRVGASLVIGNDDHQDWRNVRVTLNDRFKCHADAVGQNDESTIPLAACVADDGSRFNLLLMAPAKVYVTAVLVDDTGEASNMFEFEH